MPLKSYTKHTNYATGERGYYKPVHEHSSEELVITEETPERRTTMWSVLSSCYSGFKKLVASSNTAGIIIPALFIFAGLGFVYLQVQPDITHHVKESVGYYNQGTASPVEDSYIETRMQYVSNPGADYFNKLAEVAQQQAIKQDKASLSYKGIMYLTIPRLKFKRLPVRANVESNVKDAYLNALKSTLAHFKGTSLPISPNANNTVIYGHSASGNYNPNPNDVLAAFSFLPNLQIGDEIILEMDGKKYKYRMQKSKIVTPDETSIITGTPGKKTLTLFTCWPPGNNNHRYVAIATPIT